MATVRVSKLEAALFERLAQARLKALERQMNNHPVFVTDAWHITERRVMGKMVVKMRNVNLKSQDSAQAPGKGA